ncbi:MAG: hypothetical protein HYV60_22535 [Planctomycetia bacterium]|nr:hypothetical protein [Planctomycetia bacterium]
MTITFMRSPTYMDAYRRRLLLIRTSRPLGWMFRFLRRRKTIPTQVERSETHFDMLSASLMNVCQRGLRLTVFI